jgi:hypothetical protein
MVYWSGAELKSRLARSNRISIYKAVYGFRRIFLLGDTVNKEKRRAGVAIRNPGPPLAYCAYAELGWLLTFF